MQKWLLALLPLLIACGRPAEIDLSSGWKIKNINISSISFPDGKIPDSLYEGMTGPEADTSTWQEVKSLPAALTMERKKQLCLLRREVFIPESMKGKDISLYLGKVWDSQVTYFNGVRTGSSGNDYPDFHSDWNVSTFHHIPPELVRYGAVNVIVIRQFSDQQLNFNGAPFIGYTHSVTTYTYAERFMAEYLVMALGIMTLILGLVILAVYFFGRFRSIESLHFGGLSILWFILTLHFWLPGYGFMSWRVQDNIFYLLVGILVAWIYISLESILGFKNIAARVTISVLCLVQAIIALSATVNSPVTGWRFDVMGPIGVLGQIMWGYVIVRGIRAGNVEAKIIMTGYVIFVVTLVHDALMMNRVIMSYAFLTNIAYPCFILSFAIILMRRIAQLNENLMISKTEIEKKNSDLEEVMKLIAESAEELRTISSSVSDSSVMLNIQMENQTESLVQTSASVEEVSGSITAIAGHTSDQDNLVRESGTILEGYLNSINRITGAARQASSLGGRSREVTSSINEKLMLVRDGMLKIKDSSSAIEQIADIINDIAEKTNLLSLNAAIEAARAGQFGRGFAVVADEIGKLADGSVEQAKTIQRIIQGVVSDIENENRLIMESADSVSTLKSAAEDVNNAVNDIMMLCENQEALTARIHEGMKNISSGSNEISIATREQQSAMNEVLSAILSLSEVVEQVNFGTLKMLGISEKLKTRVDILNSLAAVKQAG